MTGRDRLARFRSLPTTRQSYGTHYGSSWALARSPGIRICDTFVFLYRRAFHKSSPISLRVDGKLGLRV